ncbi:MAG: serine hydrolase domain-containing protein, partial [Acidimicrobiales bacterium]
MTTRALDLVEDWPARRLAVAVVAADGSTEMTGAHDEIFALASLTKLETAMAVLVAAEEGTVDLDEPVTEAGATVADLLGHSSGIAPDSPEQLSSPRSRRIYSTAAYDTVASLVSDRAAMPFARYLHEAVFAPLGMRHSRLLGSAGADAVGTITDLIRLVAAWRAPRLVHDSTLARATTAWLPELDGVLPGCGGRPLGLGTG